jgi:UDP-2-acetamido-3-amino-2,3-dideoxy-glucuronate N-acetyltransferase
MSGIRIGAYAFIGAGAVLTSDVPDHALVLGAPARVKGFICACGETISRARTRPKRALCPECGLGPG